MWMPRGYTFPAEARLETFGPRAIPGADWSELRKWWLRHERGANTPNWDAALSCDIEGNPGLVLVEAKANVPELGLAGKPKVKEHSQASGENHDHIKSAIANACAELRRVDPGVAISCDSHYQLSNRVAFGWKLASLGVPTVIVYLGFLGDSGIRDAGLPFESDTHWQKAFADYSRSVLPSTLVEQRINSRNAPMWVLVRSRPIQEVSPPRVPRAARAQQ
jgi:hypothetical protein